MRDPVAVRVPFCGLPCAPLFVHAGTDPLPVEGGCAVARAAASRATAPGGPRVGGTPTTLQAALDRAAEILAAARRPHVDGLAWSTVETARRAARLARRLGGSIDIEGADALRAEIETVRSMGLVGATFGAVRERADVVLLWRDDPRPAHPELLPPTVVIDGAPQMRRVILLPPVGDSAGAPPGDAGRDLEAIAALRTLLARGAGAGAPASTTGAAAPTAGSAGGLSLTMLVEAAEALRHARFAAVVWGDGAARGPGGTAVVMALARLVRDLDGGGRAVARSLGAGGNLAGAMSALLSETGLPRAVRFECPDGAAVPDPFDGAPAANRGDRRLLIGPRAPVADGAPAAVCLGPDLPAGFPEPEVFIPTAVPGLSGGGTWLRADGIALPVRHLVDSEAPLEEEVLDALLDRLPARAAVVA